MDIKITRNNIIETKKMAVGYCDLQDALSFYDRIGYACGVYGWNYDYYSIGGIAILTGYRPEGKHVSYKKCEHINAVAKKLRDNWDYSVETYPDFKERAQHILTPMIKALGEEAEKC